MTHSTVIRKTSNVATISTNIQNTIFNLSILFTINDIVSHLDNIMVKTKYPDQTMINNNILDFYKSFHYEYYFIDMGKSFDLENSDQEYRDYVEVLDHLYELA